MNPDKRHNKKKMSPFEESLFQIPIPRDGEIMKTRVCFRIRPVSESNLFVILTLLKAVISFASCLSIEMDHQGVIAFSYFYYDDVISNILHISLAFFTIALALIDCSSTFFVNPLRLYSLMDCWISIVCALNCYFDIDNDSIEEYIIPFIGIDNLFLYIICVVLSLVFKFYYLIFISTLVSQSEPWLQIIYMNDENEERKKEE